MVLIAESEADLQSLFDHMYGWCYKWRLSVNKIKLRMFISENQGNKKHSMGFVMD